MAQQPYQDESKQRASGRYKDGAEDEERAGVGGATDHHKAGNLTRRLCAAMRHLRTGEQASSAALCLHWCCCASGGF